MGLLNLNKRSDFFTHSFISLFYGRSSLQLQWKGHLNKQTDLRMDEHMDKHADERTDERMDEGTDERTDG